jgi:hypothetical protein
VRKKNKEKTTEYKEEKDKKDLEEISKLPEGFEDLAELRAFRNTSIPQEVPKPPVIASTGIELTKEEIEIPSKGPKFTLRNIICKENYMAEFEKGLVKKKFGDIGKEEIDGKVIVETPEDG